MPLELTEFLDALVAALPFSKVPYPDSEKATHNDKVRQRNSIIEHAHTTFTLHGPILHHLAQHSHPWNALFTKFQQARGSHPCTFLLPWCNGKVPSLMVPYMPKTITHELGEYPSTGYFDEAVQWHTIQASPEYATHQDSVAPEEFKVSPELGQPGQGSSQQHLPAHPPADSPMNVDLLQQEDEDDMDEVEDYVRIVDKGQARAVGNQEDESSSRRSDSDGDDDNSDSDGEQGENPPFHNAIHSYP